MRLAVGAALASLALAAPASAAPVEMQGKLTISVAGAGSALVRFAEATRVSPDANGAGAIDFHFSGQAVAKGLVFLAERPGTDGKRYAAYVDGSVGEAGEGSFASGQIPAGDYRLYAFSDGRAAAIAITMPTGSGESALALSDPAIADIHRMQPGGSGGVFRASATTTGPGTTFAAAEATFGSGQAGTVEFCDAVGQSAETDAPYTLGCSQGDVFPVIGGGDFDSTLVSTRFDTSAAERHGFGGNAQSLAPPTIDGGVVAITFTPPGVPGQASTPISPVGAVAARVLSTKVRATKTGRVPVKVRCAGPGACHVRLSVSGSSSKGRATIPAGATRKVNVRLSSALRKRLKHSRSIRATLVLRVSGDSGGATVTRSRVSLTAPRR